MKRRSPFEKPLVCRDCKLYDKKNQLCKVTVILKEQKYELHTLPDDRCAWEKEGIDVQEIRVYSDGKDGYVQYTDENLEIKKMDLGE